MRRKAHNLNTAASEAIIGGYNDAKLKKAKAMQAIFVMIKCALGRAYAVAETLADEVDEISEVHSISGQYDLLAKFYLPKDADIGHFVTEKVQTLDGVADTFTMITFKAFK